MEESQLLAEINNLQSKIDWLLKQSYPSGKEAEKWGKLNLIKRELEMWENEYHRVRGNV